MRKINFPKYVIILAGSASALINLGLNFIVIAIFMFVNGVEVTPNILLIIPLVLQLFVLSLGVAFLLSALFVKLRDVIYIWDVVTQAGFYLTPVLYLITLLPDRLARLSVLNPMAQIIQDARYALVTRQSATIANYWDSALVWLIPISLCLLILAVGALYFRSQSKKFAEEV